MISVELERGPYLGTRHVESIKDELWIKGLGGSMKNIRIMLALYTYSRTEGDKIIFRYRKSIDILESEIVY